MVDDEARAAIKNLKINRNITMLKSGCLLVGTVATVASTSLTENTWLIGGSFIVAQVFGLGFTLGVAETFKKQKAIKKMKKAINKDSYN